MITRSFIAITQSDDGFHAAMFSWDDTLGAYMTSDILYPLPTLGQARLAAAFWANEAGVQYVP